MTKEQIKEDRVETMLKMASHLGFRITSFEHFDYKPETIPVPDCVHLHNGDSILFNKDKQVLKMNNGVYAVYTIRVADLSQKPHELTKCKREDLKPGEVAFAVNVVDEISLQSLCNYVVILDEDNAAHVEFDNVIVDDCSDLEHWYKATPVKG